MSDAVPLANVSAGVPWARRPAYAARMRVLAIAAALLVLATSAVLAAEVTVYRPDRVFDGESVHEGWVVVVEGETIAGTLTVQGVNMT